MRRVGAARPPRVPAASSAVTPPAASIWRAGLPQLGGLGALLFVLGGGWDVAWHIDVGRDTFWSPPHLMLYAGVLLVLGALALGLRQADQARRVGAAPAGPSVALPGGLRLNPGLLIAGLGAVMSLSSAPVDDAWHRIFGLDLTIWSPPHLQLIGGVGVAALGLLAALAGELNHADPRRRSSVAPLDATPQVWGLLALAALLLTIALVTLAEYEYGVPHFALAYHPLILGFATPAVLLAGARASGRRWSATAIGLLHLGVLLLLQLELALAGRTRPLLIVVPLAGVAVDLLWQRRGQSPRPLVVVAVGAAGAAAALATEVPYLLLVSPLPWALQPWPALLPAAVLAGAAGGIFGATVGAALRPELPPARGKAVRRVGAPLAALALAGLVGALALAAGGAPAQAHGPAEVVVGLAEPSPVAGAPLSLRLEVRLPDGPPGPGGVRVRLEQAERHVQAAVQPSGQPGHYTATATLPTPGQWVLGVRVETDEGPTIGWTFLQVASPGGVVRNAPEQRLELRPGEGLDGMADGGAWLLVGKALVWAFTAALLVGVALCLRLIAADARALDATGLAAPRAARSRR